LQRPDATSAKGISIRPARRTGTTQREHHGGDMPNLVADAAGMALYRRNQWSEPERPTGVVGRSVVIHADPTTTSRNRPAIRASGLPVG
jgi:Cu-Zn family superoxide dismutase